MATQPSTFLNWLGGVSNPSSNYQAQPPIGQLDTGFVGGQPPPFQYMNYALWLLDQWVQYLNTGTNNLAFVSVTSGPYSVSSPTKTVFANPSAGSFSVNLPSSVSNPGYEVTIKNTDISGTIAVTVGLVSSTDQIEDNGAGVSTTLNAGDVLKLKSDGTGNYWVME